MNYWIDMQKREWGTIEGLEAGSSHSLEMSLSSLMGCSTDTGERDQLELIDRMGLVVLDEERFRVICRYLESMSVILKYSNESWEFVLYRAQKRGRLRQMLRTAITRSSKKRNESFVRLAA